MQSNSSTSNLVQTTASGLAQRITQITQKIVSDCADLEKNAAHLAELHEELTVATKTLRELTTTAAPKKTPGKRPAAHDEESA